MNPSDEELTPSARAAKEALSTGIRFAPFSCWPLAWHELVMPVLREAKLASIRQLYIKEKFGGLRIQGGGARLAGSVVQAERAADRACVSCGLPAIRPASMQWPRCPSCEGRPRDEVQWVDPSNC